MATLYRKYRPQNFEEIVGQNHIKLTLEQEIKSQRTAHSYLFCGPRAVGKTTLARVLAKALNCQTRRSEQSEPCNNCVACQDITAGRALDVIEIDAASHTGVDNVRENIIANARVSPVSLKYKVFIIDEVHMLSGPAFNALLKIMEEPPSFVIFILCTTEIHKVPSTIISRCQRFDFKKISITDIVKKLSYIIKQENIKVDKAILENIARQSGGHMRDAESLLGQIVALVDGGQGKDLRITQEEAELIIPKNDLAEVLNLISLLTKKDAANGLRLVNKLVDDGFDLKVFTLNLIEILRQMILVKINPKLIVSFGLDLGENLEAKLIEANSGLQVNQLLHYIETFIKAEPQLKDSFILQLPLELAIVSLCAETVSGPAVMSIIRPSAAAEPTKPVSSIASGVISQEQLTARWPEFLNRVKQNNHSLSFILKSCLLSGVDGQAVCLTFRHKFHQERINETEIKKLVEQALRDIYGLNLSVKALLDETAVIEQSNDVEVDNNEKNSNNAEEIEHSQAIDNVLKNFGGKIIK